MKRVIFVDTIWRFYASQIRARLGAQFDVSVVSELGETDARDRALRRLLPDADVIVSSRLAVEHAAWAGRVSLVHASGAGTDGMALGMLPPSTRVCRTGNHGRAIAEYVVMAMKALQTGLLSLDRELRQGRWLNPQFRTDAPLAEGLEGKQAVILGTGEIGRWTAEFLRFYGLETTGVYFPGHAPRGSVFSRTVAAGEVASCLTGADFVVVALPLVRETVHFVGE